jgi:hypothetical protein
VTLGSRVPHLRLVALCVVLAASLPAAARAAVLEQPDAGELGSAAAIIEGELSAAEARALREEALVWGGRFTTAAGEAVTLWFSDTYQRDFQRAQGWAEFMGRLVHGAELATVTTYILPLAEVQAICGSRAVACFSGGTIVTPGEDPAPNTSAESILAHEFGHHVAANRTNAPWRALDFGTKRWASYENVCAGARVGSFFPGAEDPDRYHLNPGEGFAEAYRVLNERRAAVLESPWEIVSRAFYPDATALQRLEADVLAPWTRNRSSAVGGSFARRGVAVRSHVVATPLDGTLRISIRARRADLRIELRTAQGALVSRTAVVAGTSATLGATVCGARTYRVRVTRLFGAGPYRVTISKP